MFSIVIPTYNRSRLVTYAIDSMLKQTFRDFEIVVCDNCSIDDTEQVIRRVADADPRVRYVRPPKHGVIADNWEFARSQARGRLIIMLSDDDAFVPTALERLADASRRHEADFLFCGVAEYRDASFPGPGRNTLACSAFSGRARLVLPKEFVEQLFAFRGHFNMHPSAFVFARALADLVASRCGRFFQTNGVEYFAWPLAAALARRIVHVDAPLCICGRTGASWGSNLSLANPGQDRIEQLIADVEQKFQHVPLNNFTTSNLWAEGVLTAQKLLPVELGDYEFDEAQYLRVAMRQLLARRSQGVDVSRDIDELLAYAQKWPALAGELAAGMGSRDTPGRTFRSRIGRLGGSAVARRIRAFRNARRAKRGEVTLGFRVRGVDCGFHDIVGCAEFLNGVVQTRQERLCNRS